MGSLRFPGGRGKVKPNFLEKSILFKCGSVQVPARLGPFLTKIFRFTSISPGWYFSYMSIAPRQSPKTADFTEEEKDELFKIFRATLDRQSKIFLCLIHIEETLAHVRSQLALDHAYPSNVCQLPN